MVLFYNSFLKSCGSLRQLFSCIGVKSCVSIGNILRQKYQWQVTVTSVLALATLGDETQIEIYLCHITQGDQDKYSHMSVKAVACCCCHGFTNKRCQCKWSIIHSVLFDVYGSLIQLFFLNIFSRKKKLKRRAMRCQCQKNFFSSLPLTETTNKLERLALTSFLVRIIIARKARGRFVPVGVNQPI